MSIPILGLDLEEHPPVDATNLSVASIPAGLARTLAERHHYMHRKPQVTYGWGLHHCGEILGIVTFGTPASRHLQMGACPSNPGNVIELNRLWLHDDLPNGTASWFLARVLRRMPPLIVVSYADTRAGHMGYVYRAANFRYAGWTDMERNTPRLDYLPADPSIHTRDAMRNGYVAKVRRKPKIKYWTVTGTPLQRRFLVRTCGWPSLSWREHPPPTEHRRLVLP